MDNFFAETKAAHDMLLSTMPEGVTSEEFDVMVASHKSAHCQYCDEESSTDLTHEGSEDVQTYSQAELDATVAKAVSEATAPLQEELTLIRQTNASTEAQSAVDAAVAEVREELQGQIDTLNASLEEAKVEAATYKASLEELESLLTSAQEEAEAAAWIDAVKELRIAQIAEVASLDEEFVKANIDRWAQEDEDAFAGRLAEWKAIADVSKASVSPKGETAAPTVAQLVNAVQGPSSQPVETDSAGIISVLY